MKKVIYLLLILFCLFVVGFIYFFNYNYNKIFNLVELYYYNDFTLDYALMSSDNKIILPYGKFDKIYGANKNGYRSVVKKNKCGFIDNKQKIVIPIIYNNMDSYFDGLIRIVKNKKYGFIDINNKVIVSNIYDYASAFQNDIALVRSDNLAGLINNKGEIIAPIEYDKIGKEVNNRRKVVKTINNKLKIGYIDCKGNLVIPYIYSDGSDFKDGVARVYSGEKIFYINKYGYQVEKPKNYDKKYKNYEVLLNNNNKEGLIYNHRQIIPCKYNKFYIDEFSIKGFRGYKDNIIDIYDKKGNYIRTFNKLKYFDIIYTEYDENVVVVKRNYLKVIKFILNKKKYVDYRAEIPFIDATYY